MIKAFKNSKFGQAIIIGSVCMAATYGFVKFIEIRPLERELENSRLETLKVKEAGSAHSDEISIRTQPEIFRTKEDALKQELLACTDKLQAQEEQSKNIKQENVSLKASFDDCNKAKVSFSGVNVQHLEEIKQLKQELQKTKSDASRYKILLRRSYDWVSPEIREAIRNEIKIEGGRK